MFRTTEGIDEDIDAIAAFTIGTYNRSLTAERLLETGKRISCSSAISFNFRPQVVSVFGTATNYDFFSFNSRT
jgi:hypothetical protein